ncbi:hypothetical protein TNCV_460881 [Trichonephila clavipes]|nr:hypothetical protein TNCV_460881 [Trichonephila clavipes]
MQKGLKDPNHPILVKETSYMELTNERLQQANQKNMSGSILGYDKKWCGLSTLDLPAPETDCVRDVSGYSGRIHDMDRLVALADIATSPDLFVSPLGVDCSMNYVALLSEHCDVEP